MKNQDYPEYKNYLSMLKRTRAKTGKNYRDYYLKGITVCERWRGKGGFKRFLEDMGPKKPDQTIDRKDNSKGYSTENCKWATKLEQHNNTTRNVFITHKRKRLTIAQWSRKLDIHRNSISYYTRQGYTLQHVIQKYESRVCS